MKYEKWGTKTERFALGKRINFSPKVINMVLFAAQTVNYETAAELKNAGFQQPDPNEDGVLWFNIHRRLILLCHNSLGKKGGYLFEDKKWYEFDNGEITGKGACFAPNCIDILDKLPGWTCGQDTNGRWACALLPSLERRYEHNRASEACAVIWLTVNGHNVKERADRR